MAYNVKCSVPTAVVWLAFLAAVAAFPPGALAQIEVTGATILELQDAMASGQTTSARITQQYLDRIAAYDQSGPEINAIVWVNEDAVSDAAALDQERAITGARGPMHGIPVILKDNYNTTDMPTTAGTLALAWNMAAADAFQVTRLREAGAVIVGKANLHELASGITTISSMGGQTLNPYALDRNPGGSSGGTGAAIAASFAAVGWGSDTCGSIRIPAAQNDLVGLRPTKGLSSINGIIPLSHTQDVGGPLARTVRDLAIALDATVGLDPGDLATDILRGRDLPRFTEALDERALRGARIGIFEQYFGSSPEEVEATRLVRGAIERMVELGADTVTVELETLDELITGSGVINYEFKWDLIDYLEAQPAAPVSSLTEMIDRGLIHEALMPRMRARDSGQERDSEEYRAALAKRGPLRAAVEGMMNEHSLDAFVFPTVRTVPALLGEPQRGSSCSLSANTGLPSLSIQAGFTESGLPIGMEMIGRTLEDPRLVAIGYAFEQGTEHRREPWSTPPLVNEKRPGVISVNALPGVPEGIVASGSLVALNAEVAFASDLGALRYALTISGVAAGDVTGVALRYPQGDGDWQIVHLLSRPGALTSEGTVLLSEPQRRSLNLGDMHMIVLTQQHPFGAAVAALVVGG